MAVVSSTILITVFICIASIFTVSTGILTSINVMLPENGTWRYIMTSANSCTVTGQDGTGYKISNVDQMRVRKELVQKLQGTEFWTALHVEYTPWINFEGCFGVNDAHNLTHGIPKLTMASQDVVKLCLDYCNSSFFFFADYCYCLDNLTALLERDILSAGVECLVKSCGLTQDEICLADRSIKGCVCVYQPVHDVRDIQSHVTNVGNCVSLSFITDDKAFLHPRPCADILPGMCTTEDQFWRVMGDHNLIDTMTKCVFCASMNVMNYNNYGYWLSKTQNNKGTSLWIAMFRLQTLMWGNKTEGNVGCVSVRVAEDGRLETRRKACNVNLPGLCEGFLDMNETSYFTSYSPSYNTEFTTEKTAKDTYNYESEMILVVIGVGSVEVVVGVVLLISCIFCVYERRKYRMNVISQKKGESSINPLYNEIPLFRKALSVPQTISQPEPLYTSIVASEYNHTDRKAKIISIKPPDIPERTQSCRLPHKQFPTFRHDSSPTKLQSVQGDISEESDEFEKTGHYNDLDNENEKYNKMLGDSQQHSSKFENTYEKLPKTGCPNAGKSLTLEAQRPLESASKRTIIGKSLSMGSRPIDEFSKNAYFIPQPPILPVKSRFDTMYSTPNNRKEAEYVEVHSPASYLASSIVDHAKKKRNLKVNNRDKDKQVNI